MDWLTALQSALFVAVLVAGAFIGLQQGTVRTLRASNGDLRASNGDLEKDRAELRNKVAELEGAVTVLRGTVTGEAEIRAVREDLAEHHTESMNVLGDIRSALQKGAP